MTAYGLPHWAWWVIVVLGAAVTEWLVLVDVFDTLARRREARAGGAGAGSEGPGTCSDPGCAVCEPGWKGRDT